MMSSDGKDVEQLKCSHTAAEMQNGRQCLFENNVVSYKIKCTLNILPHNSTPRYLPNTNGRIWHIFFIAAFILIKNKKFTWNMGKWINR